MNAYYVFLLLLCTTPVVLMGIMYLVERKSKPAASENHKQLIEKSVHIA